MRNIIYSLFIITILNSCSTHKKSNECLNILDNELFFAKNSIKTEFEKDYKILENCGKLDSIDKVIFSPQTIGVLMVGLISENDKLTYRVIIKKINEIRNSETYSKQKIIIYQSEKLKTKIINKNEWEKDKFVFEKIGIKGERLKSFKKFISQFENSNTTYEKALRQFDETIVGKEFIAEQNKSFAFKEFENYERILETAKEEGKNILLYFAGYSAVNCRKMEEIVLTDNEIKSTLTKKYLAYSLYVDSRKKLNENDIYVSKITKREVKTVGKRLQDFQMEKFKVNQQPYFVILDRNGKIIKEQGYTKSTEEFIEFLTLE